MSARAGFHRSIVALMAAAGASVFSAPATAQSRLTVLPGPEKTWCTTWKGQKICGSRADYDLFAERKCLEAWALDDVSVSDAIRGWGDCLAAKVMAGKISFAADRHNDAVAAQKKLEELPPGPDWDSNGEEKHGR
jgi:hypothetical protein